MKISECFAERGINSNYKCHLNNKSYCLCACCVENKDIINCLKEINITNSINFSTMGTRVLYSNLENNLQKIKKSINEIYDNCNNAKHEELICKINAKKPDKTHCLCRKFTRDNTPEIYEFDTTTFWQPNRIFEIHKEIPFKEFKSPLKPFEFLFAFVNFIFVILLCFLFIYFRQKKNLNKKNVSKCKKKSRKRINRNKNMYF